MINFHQEIRVHGKTKLFVVYSLYFSLLRKQSKNIKIKAMEHVYLNLMRKSKSDGNFLAGKSIRISKVLNFILYKISLGYYCSYISIAENFYTIHTRFMFHFFYVKIKSIKIWDCEKAKESFLKRHLLVSLYSAFYP